MRRKADRPVAAGIEASGEEAAGLEQREHVGKRVQDDVPHDLRRMADFSAWIVRGPRVYLWPRQQVSHPFERSRMPDKQAPIGSGFGARTTAEAVLAGRDLTGKTAIVTGGQSGLGPGDDARARPCRRACRRCGTAALCRARGAARHGAGGGRRTRSRKPGQRPGLCPALRRNWPPCRHRHQQCRHHGLPRDAGGAWMGSAIRNQSSRPLHADQFALAGPRRRGPGRGGLVGRTSSLRHSLGRCSIRAWLRQMAGLWPVQDSQRPVCRAARRARGAMPACRPFRCIRARSSRPSSGILPRRR